MHANANGIEKDQLESSGEKDLPGVEPAKEGSFVGEGGISGEITPGSSVVFATLEVCLCVLVRHLPSLNPTILSSSPTSTSVFKQSGFGEQTIQLLSDVLRVLADLPSLCSPPGELILMLVFFHVFFVRSNSMELKF